jgi:hypothetical protein
MGSKERLLRQVQEARGRHQCCPPDRSDADGLLKLRLHRKEILPDRVWGGDELQ